MLSPACTTARETPPAGARDDLAALPGACFHGGSARRTDDPEAIQVFIDDLERTGQIPGIEVQISHHHDIHASGADDLFTRADRLRNRQPGAPHPWAAPDEFQRWLDEPIADAY